MKLNALLLLSCTAQALAAAVEERRELVTSKKLQEKITTKKYGYFETIFKILLTASQQTHE